MNAAVVAIALTYTGAAVWLAATVPPTPKMAWCQVAEISPDVPPADKAACRRSRKLSLAANGR